MKIEVRCPYCVHDFEVEVPESKDKAKEISELLRLSTNNLREENESLRFENQRLQILTHQHRGD